VAAQVGAEPGVNHSYLREDDWNLWFVATAPDAAALAASLARIRAATRACACWTCGWCGPSTSTLAFRLTGRRRPMMADRPPAQDTPDRQRPRRCWRRCPRGCRWCPAPLCGARRLAGHARTRAASPASPTLCAARILTRLGVIVRHRPLGWTANAMVVWDLPVDRIEAAGRALAAHARRHAVLSAAVGARRLALDAVFA
jgi:hypothetical protein